MTTIKKGTLVLVVEGAEQGSKGKVTSIARRYDEGDHAYRKMVTLTDQHGKRVTTRLAWTREL